MRRKVFTIVGILFLGILFNYNCIKVKAEEYNQDNAVNDSEVGLFSDDKEPRYIPIDKSSIYFPEKIIKKSGEVYFTFKLEKNKYIFDDPDSNAMFEVEKDGNKGTIFIPIRYDSSTQTYIGEGSVGEFTWFVGDMEFELSSIDLWGDDDHYMIVNSDRGISYDHNTCCMNLEDKFSFIYKSGNYNEVHYSTHIQSIGWQDWCIDGEISGTTGKGYRLEAICIGISKKQLDGDIEYRTHVQSIGWQDWVKNGETSGTEGQALRLEAIQIKLTGEMAEQYDIYYCVHSQTYGWLNWAKNGEIAGTAGQSKRLEAIKIMLVAKGGDAPDKIGTDDRSYVQYYVGYRTHVQTYGWQPYVYDGTMSGTTGESKRLEAINIKLMNQEYDGDIEYQTHVQTYGWERVWKKDGDTSGTSGEAKRLEAIRIRLTDEMADKYDVYYRVHAQTFGWLGWAKNGKEAGTAGYGKRLEGIEIVLVEKGGYAPGTTEGAFVEK